MRTLEKNRKAMFLLFDYADLLAAMANAPHPIGGNGIAEMSETVRNFARELGTPETKRYSRLADSPVAADFDKKKE